MGRRSEFDLDVTFAHKNNRKVKALLYEQVRKRPRFDLLTTSQVNAIIRSKYAYLMSKAKGKTVVSPKTTCRSRVNTVSISSFEDDTIKYLHGYLTIETLSQEICLYG